MAGDPNLVEQAIARALRENLYRIQRGSEDLQHTINDLVSACASSRPTNAWPAIVRAQTSAASLAAALEVLSRFIATSLPPASPQAAPDIPVPVSIPQPAEAPKTYEPLPPTPMGRHSDTPGTASAIVGAVSELEVPPAKDIPPPKPLAPQVVQPEPSEPRLFVPEPLAPQPEGVDLPLEEPATPAPEVLEQTQEPAPQVLAPVASAEPAFDIASLPSDLQELHRRAYRVAKVTMQDIKMIHPDEVRQGRENKDLCIRLRDDIEKAHREYIRRFESILSHPVDYFYDWMVQILAEGDPTALGEYPYPSAVLHR